jgi:hypothetical protein
LTWKDCSCTSHRAFAPPEDLPRTARTPRWASGTSHASLHDVMETSGLRRARPKRS